MYTLVKIVEHCQKRLTLTLANAVSAVSVVCSR